MKRAILRKHDEIKLVEENIPQITDTDILVRVIKCGICTGELMDWYVDMKAPYTPGHEIVGIVHKVGSNVKNFNIGERVVVHHHAPCMVCDSCLRGDYVHCDTWRKSKIYPGGFSEYIRVPEEIHKVDVLKIKQNISDDDAALIEPLATSVKAVKRAGIKPCENVLGIGLGFMGILNLKVCQVFGAKIFGVDIQPTRIELAGKFLENVGNYEDLGDNKFDVVIVAPGNSKAINEGLKYVRRGGRIVMFAPLPPSETLSLDANRIYFDEITIIPSYSAGPDDMRLAMSIIKDVKPSELITHRIKLENLNWGFKLAKRPEALKVMVEIG